MKLQCAACGWTAGPTAVDPYPFRCPNAGTDDGDHVMMVTRVNLGATTPDQRPGDQRPTTNNQQPSNPFVRYRSRLYSWHVAISNGVSDDDFAAIVDDLDRAVARVAGTGFHPTPFARSSALSAELGLDDEGGVWVKNETGNVSGSHKARHLMGVALYLRVLGRLGLDKANRPLAVASCGNAALAAAVMARALDRTLLVFVPEHASPAVVAELTALGACVMRCTREPGVAGDPSYLAFRRAVDQGALPFTCQGNENGLAIEGGMTLAWEMADEHVALDRLLVQAGGGALASACVQGLQGACAARGAALPRIHAVQTRGGYPLKRAYDRVVDDLFARVAERHPAVRIGFAGEADRARYLARVAPADVLERAFAEARTHRSAFMRPWESEPRSIASGILDDETYDWAVVVEAMVRTAGFPILADEQTLEQAHALGRRATGIDADHTGTAGLAGLVSLCQSIDRPAASERIAVLFTGRTR